MESKAQDGPIMYLGDTNVGIDSVLFPGTSTAMYSRQLAQHYAHRFEATASPIYAILSIRLSLRFAQPLEQSVSSFLLLGLDKYVAGEGQSTLDSCLELKGKGSSSAHRLVIKTDRDSAFSTNLYLLQHVFGLPLSTAKKLVYERDGKSMHGAEMTYPTFDNLARKLLDELELEPPEANQWHWSLLPDDTSKLAYLDTFMKCEQLEPSVRDGLKACKNQFQP